MKQKLCTKCFTITEHTVSPQLVKHMRKRRTPQYKAAKRLLKQEHSEVCLDCFYKEMGGQEWEDYKEKQEEHAEMDRKMKELKNLK